MSSENKITRRTFIKGAAAAGATAATAAMLGATPAFAAAGAPDKWDAEADVIIIGTGVAGYCAAIEAKDAGASVIVVEKAKWVGGNTALSMGNAQFPGNYITKNAGIQDSLEWAYEDYVKNGEHRNSTELLHQFVDNAAETVTWLEKLGLVFNQKPSQQADCRVARTIVSAPSQGNYVGAAGFAWTQVLHKQVTNRQIPVKLEHKMTRFIRPDNTGPVLGIEVVNAGKTLNFKAKKAVILATGGYKANHQMLRANNPLLDEEWGWSGGPYVQPTGEGHLAAMAVGAGMVDGAFTMSFSMRFGTPVYSIWEPQEFTTPTRSAGAPYKMKNNSTVFIENDGNRYFNEYTFDTMEAELRHPWIEAYLWLPKRPRNVWAVVDADGATDMGWKPEAFKNPLPTNTPYLDPKYVAYAETLADLAAKMGVPPDNFQATIKKYNEYATAGEDKDFGRPKGFTPIAKPPFLAAKLAPMGHDQCNGIRINTKMQVIEQAFQATTGSGPSVAIDKEPVIPHLYAAGEITGGLFGASRGHGKMGAYAVQGRIAGKTVVNEKAWDAAT